MTFVALTLDKPNLNGRVYPTDVVAKAVEKYREQIAERRGLGIIADYQHNPNIDIDLSKVSHIVESIDIVDNELRVGVRVLGTPAGESLQKLLADGGISFRPRGIGFLRQNEEGHSVVSDYTLISVDAILTERAA